MNTVIEQKITNKGRLETWLIAQKNKNFLRFLTCGSVDDGKSTLIGRLLHDTFQIYKDQLLLLNHDSKRYGTQGVKLDFALLVDGLQAEREQGITIDVAYRYFSTDKCKFIIADTPGHEQYTRNMATGASTSDVAIVLIDARKGILDQTRRHSFIAILLGIKHLVIAINKMDLVEYNKEIFENIEKDYITFSKKLPANLNFRFIPISALKGDNVVTRSSTMLWYNGPTLLNILETIEPNRMIDHQPMRFPVQYVNRPNFNFRGYSGTLVSGMIKVGQRVKVMPVNLESTIMRIVTFDGDLQEAGLGDAITLVLKDAIDISRGDLLVDTIFDINSVQSATVDVVWMGEKSLQPGQTYDLKIASKKTRGYVKKILHQVDMHNLAKRTTSSLPLNGIGLIEIKFDEPMILDAFCQNAVTGGMIFIDRLSNITVGAGMVNQAYSEPNMPINKYSDFELELNTLVNRYFPHWNARDLFGD